MKKRILVVSCIFMLAVVMLISCRRRDDDMQTDNTFRFYESINVDGKSRNYLLNLPPNYYQSSDFSLVIAMHGGGGTADQFESTSLWGFFQKHQLP